MAVSSRGRATKRDLLQFVRNAIDRGEIPAESEKEAVAELDHLVKRLALSRRDVLKATAATAGVTLVTTDVASRLGWAPSVADAAQLFAATPSLTASVLRRDDMLAIHFDFFNLMRDGKGDNLVRQSAASPAYIVASLGYGDDHAPQNIAEQAFLEESPKLSGTKPTPEDNAAILPGVDPLAQPGEVQARLAARTRLAFRVPDATLAIPFTLSALLDFAQFPMSVAPTALPPGAMPVPAPTMRAPNETETALEMPWSLTMSPHSGSTFTHATKPVVRNGRTELWHTRLAVRKPTADPAKWVADETDSANRTVRAIWADGFDRTSPPPSADETPFRMSLKKKDRWQIVRLSSDYDLPPMPPGFDPKYWPRPIDVERLMLTALGGWQRTRGYFAEPPTTFNLGEWRHVATMARDHYVKVVYLGWLLPFRHKAALIKVTERKIQQVPTSSARGAYLRQRFFVVVRTPVVEYPDASPQPDGGREMPYKSVEIKTLVTPTLDNPSDPAHDFESKKDLAFFPFVGGKVFSFSIAGTDRDGQKSEFTMPLAFVSYPLAGDLTDTEIDQIAKDYDNGEYDNGGTDFPVEWRTAQLNGQKVGMAPSTKSAGVVGGKPGDTAVEIKNILWGTKDAVGTVLNAEAPWFPRWREAEVRLNGVEQVQGGSLAKTVIQPHPKYVELDFDSSETFAQLKTNVALSFTDTSAPAVDRAGGLVNPDMSIGGLSRKLGPVGGDVKTLIPASFDPKTFFKGAKILGGIKLEDIVEVVSFATGSIPKLNTNTIYPGGDTSQPPQALETTLHFVPDLKKDEPLHVFDPETDGATMTIDAKFHTPILPPGEPTYEIVGDLRNFRVNLLGDEDPARLIQLSFNQLKFTTKNGKKPNIDVDIRDVQFVGILAFVQTLKDFLKLGGTGPNIDITPTQVTAGFAIPIPTVGVGVLTIQNIAFGAALTIPFTGKPARVRFNFSEREDPFLVTVIGLGGGGFFAIALGLDGLEVLEMSIEVGASVALNLGVASGEVHALVGLYFKLERIDASPTPAPDGTPEHDQASLTGYVRLGGSLDVLGIVSVSIELYLGLTYEFSPANELWGQAKLTIEVEVLMFSKTFEFSVEKRIPGPDLSGSAARSGIAALGGGTGSHVASITAKKNAAAFDFTDLVSEDEWDEYTAAFATS